MSEFQYKAFGKRCISIPFPDGTDVNVALDWVDNNISETEWRPGDVVISTEAQNQARRLKGIVTLQDRSVAIRRWDPESDDEHREDPWIWDWVSENVSARPSRYEVKDFYNTYPERRPKLKQYQRKTS